MKILNTEKSVDTFFKHLYEASHKALFLDYDGTLAPFREDRRNAHPYPGISELLKRLIKAPHIRLVIISGRWTRDLLPLLPLDEQPEIWGSHGLERLRPDGSYEIESMDEEPLNGLVTADEWIEGAGLAAHCEKKPGCLAIHWRGQDEQGVAEIRRKVQSKLPLIAEGWGLSLNEFDGGIELRVPGKDKGDAVTTTLNEMDKGTVAAYLGDDFTDESAFMAIKGRGMGILVREDYRPTAADLWLKPPDELVNFLSHWIS